MKMAIFISTVIKTLSLLAIFFYLSLTFSISSHTALSNISLSLIPYSAIFICTLFNEMTTIPLFIWESPLPGITSCFWKNQSLQRLALLMHTSAVKIITNTEAPVKPKWSKFPLWKDRIK